MLAAWTEILPLFLVRQFALWQCQRLPFHSETIVEARPGTMFVVPPEPTCMYHPDEPLFEHEGLPMCVRCDIEALARERKKAPHGRCHKHGEPFRVHSIAQGQEFLRCFRCDPQESFPGEHPF